MEIIGYPLGHIREIWKGRLIEIGFALVIFLLPAAKNLRSPKTQIVIDRKLGFGSVVVYISNQCKQDDHYQILDYI